MKLKKLLAALMFCWGSVSFASAAGNAMAPDVTLEEMKAIVASGKAKIIDVNSKTSYKEGHIPTAVSFAQHEDAFAKVLPKNKGDLIVAYCGGPMCKAWEDAAKKAKELGYTNIKHFSGGIKGWKDAGQKTEKGA